MIKYLLVFFSLISIYGCSSHHPVENNPKAITKITENQNNGNYFVQIAFYSIPLKNGVYSDKIENLINNNSFFISFNDYSEFHNSLANDFSVFSSYNTSRINEKIIGSFYDVNPFLSSISVVDDKITREFSNYETGVKYSFVIKNNNNDKKITTHVLFTDIKEKSKFLLNNEPSYYPVTKEMEIFKTFSIKDFNNDTIYYDYQKDEDSILVTFYYITN